MTWRGMHLRMDVLSKPVRPACGRSEMFETLVMLTVASFVAWQSFKYVERIYALGAVSDIAHIPTWIPHSAVAVSFGAMVLIVLLRAVQRIAGGDRPVRDAEQTGS